MDYIEIALLILLVVCGVCTCVTKNLLVSLIIFMAYSTIMAVVWALLESPDLAVTEAAVGAGITSILFFLTLRRLGREALIDPDITVNVIKGGEIVEKKKMTPPKEIKGVLKCHNPRCISSIEQGLPQVFYLADEKNEVYRCKYCDEKYTEGDASKN